MLACKVTQAQRSTSLHIAGQRHLYNQYAGTKHNAEYGFSDKDWNWDYEINSCMSEMMLSQWLNLYWDGGTLGKYDELDCGGLVQVRWTKWTNGHLPLHDKDKDHEPFVLAVRLNNKEDELGFPGWCFAGEGKAANPKGNLNGRAPWPAYWVPQDQLRLRSMESLREWVRDNGKLYAADKRKQLTDNEFAYGQRRTWTNDYVPRETPEQEQLL